jgi:succinate-semialdehyde dehydrogenase/glutarate-semialdehyde dehydrogenase
MVVESLADSFLEKFKVALSKFKPGNPMNATTTLAPMCSEHALQRLLGQVELAIENGAKVVMGGKRIDMPGSFMQPTILTNITPDNPAFKEEFFGPVVLFFKVKDEDEAIKLANDTEYGLGGSIFTKDLHRAKRLASRIDTGMVFINHPTWTLPDLPFGGTKNSGYGRELSSQGIEEFVNRKLIRVESIDAAA